MDLQIKLPPARPNIQIKFLSALLEARDMWLSGKRYIRRQSKSDIKKFDKIINS